MHTVLPLARCYSVDEPPTFPNGTLVDTIIVSDWVAIAGQPNAPIAKMEELLEVILARRL